MGKVLLVALDIATNMGVVYKMHPGGKFYCTTYKGTPVEQVDMLFDVLGDDINGAQVFIEELNTFVNATTTRSLLRRSGYIENCFKRAGANVQFFNAVSARKYIGAKNKADVKEIFSKYGLDGDQADAMAIMCFAMDYNISLINSEDVICLTTE